MQMENQELMVETNEKLDKKKPPAAAIQAWLVSYLAQLLEINPNELDFKASFDRYGLDSSATIGLTTDLGDWLGFAIDPTITYDYSSIESLAEYLAAL
jgi:acyl carrier protein